ncbi:MAG: CocE/NonD family hydrolase [Tepidisphaeraceae bacterium]
MQRPVMNPMFMEEKDSATKGKPRMRPLRLLGAWLLRGLKLVWRIFFTSVFKLPRARLRVEDGTPLRRFVRGLMYRLAFVPVILVLFVVALVFAVTHPPHFPPESDPLIQGVYYDPVAFHAEDGTRLEGWLVPVYDAKRIVEEKERGLHKKHPAIVLVHDYAATRQQMLPLVPQLHEAGMVVLVVGLRGTGPSGGAGQTFGLKEAMDVRAAVDMLRRRSYVDPAKVSVMGIGTGANAAVIAAEQDANIAALVLDRPIEGFEQAMANRLGDEHRWLYTLMPLFKWTFEAMYHVDADDLNVSSYAAVTSARPTLRFQGSGTVDPFLPQNAQGVTQFLRAHRVSGAGKAVASTRD